MYRIEDSIDTEPQTSGFRKVKYEMPKAVRLPSLFMLLKL